MWTFLLDGIYTVMISKDSNFFFIAGYQISCFAVLLLQTSFEGYRLLGIPELLFWLWPVIEVWKNAVIQWSIQSYINLSFLFLISATFFSFAIILITWIWCSWDYYHLLSIWVRKLWKTNCSSNKKNHKLTLISHFLKIEQIKQSKCTSNCGTLNSQTITPRLVYRIKRQK